MELNRLIFNPSSNEIDQCEKSEEIMLLGMFLIGKIMAIKILMKPSQCGMGINPSKL